MEANQLIDQLDLIDWWVEPVSIDYWPIFSQHNTGN